MNHHRLIALLVVILLWILGVVCAFADSDDDAIFAWKKWSSIDAAIALRPLDGPEDIREKAEIIEDRIDELKREKARLEREIDLSNQKLQSLRNQKAVLQELEDVKMGSDSQGRQRLQDLSERIRREEHLLKMKRKSLAELEVWITKMTNLAAEYREKARILEIQEGGTQ
jgi:predicted nuclease with TOPRIM domain